MRSRGVLVAVVVVLVVAAAFVAAGLLFDASLLGVAAIIVAVAVGAAALGLMALLLTLIGTVRELTDTVVASVQRISGTAENIADVVHSAVANPLIKAIAFTTGTGVALKAARKVTD